MPTTVDVGMDWLGFVKIKSVVPTSGELWNSICLSGFLFLLFPSPDSEGRGKAGQRLHGSRWQEQKIANEETAFGNSVNTSGIYVLCLTPALGGGAGGLGKGVSVHLGQQRSS